MGVLDSKPFLWPLFYSAFLVLSFFIEKVKWIYLDGFRAASNMVGVKLCDHVKS